MIKRTVLLTATMAVVLLSVSVLWAQSPVGKWKTLDDAGKATSIVSIYEQNGLIYGKVLELLDPAKKKDVCSKCEGADKGQPIEGIVMIKDLKKDGDQYSGGTILDPGKGKIYKGKLKVIDGGQKLKVSGCIGFICIGKEWLKAD